MRTTKIGFMACTLFIAATDTAPGQPAPGPPLQRGAVLTEPDVPDVALQPISDQEIAGLPRASQPTVLTWERIYALALVRARRDADAAAVDVAALADLSAQYGVADFARFRADFTGGGPFRDPGPAVLDLERRLLAIEGARRNAAVLEMLHGVIVERSQGDDSGLDRIAIDTMFDALVRAREKVADEIRQFRDGLDDLRVLLGLSPRAQVVLDRPSIQVFSAVFETVESWARNSTRRAGDLPLLIDRFPAPGDVILQGEPILESIDKNPDLWEEVLAKAARRAQKTVSDRGEGPATAQSAGQLELRVRRQIRALFDKRRRFQPEKRRYELAVRLRDQALERLLAPPTEGGTSRSPFVTVLVEQMARALESQDRLASLWCSLRAERLWLYHDLGELPHGDWKAFYADLSALPNVTAPMDNSRSKAAIGR